MTQQEFEAAMVVFEQQTQEYQAFYDTVGQYVSGTFAYVGVPADFMPTVTCCDTTINGIRYIGSEEEMPALTQYAVTVVALPVAPEAPLPETPPTPPAA
jgi:hypothetical protein